MKPSLLLPIQLGSASDLRSLSCALSAFSDTLVDCASEVITSDSRNPSRIWNWFLIWFAGSSSICNAVLAGIWVRSLYRPYWIFRTFGSAAAARSNALPVRMTSAASRMSAILLVDAPCGISTTTSATPAGSM